MPVHPGKDKKGPYFRWGSRGKKYRYTKGDKASRERARKLAGKQGAAAHAGGYKGNKMKPRLQRMTANFTGSVRYDEMEGRKFLVAPMIILCEGVHEGNNGPLLYPADEIKKTPQVWNHKPVVVYHPARNGAGVSACDPVILSNRKVGVMMNAHVGDVDVKINDKKTTIPGIKVEAWLEEDRMNKVDERIAVAIEKNEMMELSTGLFTDNESMSGEWNGEKYDAIARNYRPDHLALLPDLKGACSIEDGAGFLRLNALPDKIHVIGNAMSHGNIRSLLNSWLQDKNDDREVWDVYVEAVYDDFFIYLDGGKYFKYDYSLANNEITVTGDAEEVVRVTEFRTKDGKFVGNSNDISNRKEHEMNKKKIVDALIESNGNSWGEDDRETLTAMEESVLEKMQASEKVAAETAVKNAVKKYRAEEKKKADEEAAKLTANEDKDKDKDKKPQTTEEFIATAPPKVQSVLNNSIASYNAIKAALVKRLTDNEKCQFTEAQLNAKEIDELRHLVALASVSEPEDLNETDFSGQAIGSTGGVQNVEPLVMPPVMGATKSE